LGFLIWHSIPLNLFIHPEDGGSTRTCNHYTVHNPKEDQEITNNGLEQLRSYKESSYPCARFEGPSSTHSRLVPNTGE
jgi:hypothetical protein